MLGISRARLRIVALAVLASLTAACSTNLSLDNVTRVPGPDKLARKPDWATFSGGKTDFELRRITAADLIDADGRCAASDSARGSATGDVTEPPLEPGGIALQMTECDVVRRAGPIEKADLGVDERGERSLVLTYINGPRPGIYRFTSGRLVSMERAPTPPPAPPPAKPQKGAKRPAAT